MNRIPFAVVFGLCWFAAGAAALEATPSIQGTARQTHSEAAQSSHHAYGIGLGGNLDAANTLTWGEVHGRSTMEWPLFQPNVSVTIENVGETDVKSAWLVVNGRDWYSIDTLLGTVTEPDMTGREKAFAVYELFKNSFYHYNVAECRRDEEGYLVSDVLDPIKMFNCYENNGCSLHAINLATLWQRLGLKARVWNYKTIHWVSEVFYDDAWHMLDADARCFFLKDDNETVAGCADWAGNRRLLRRAHHKGDFARADPAADAEHSTHYLDENTGTPFRAQSGHCMDIDLRPGEKIVYRWDNVGKFHDNWRHKDHVPKFANGKFVYAPDFSKGYAATGVARRVNVTGFGSEPGRLTAADVSRPAELAYRFATPYVMVGGAVDLQYGCGAAGRLILDISFDGEQWQTLWEAEETAGDSAQIPLAEAIAPRSSDAKYIYWLRFGFADATLGRMVVTTDFQASLNALPGLGLGENEVVYRDATPEPHEVRITHAWKECEALIPPAAPVLKPLADCNTLSPMLCWTQPEPAKAKPITHYRIQVRFDRNMRVPVSPNLERVFAAEGSQWQAPEGWLLPDRAYYWRVRARDEAGVWSPWSDVARFELEGPGPVEALRGDNFARGAKVRATRTVGGYEVAAAVDGDATTLWAGGLGRDLRLEPADFFVEMAAAHIIDTLVVTTDRLKDQLRLTAFAVYAGTAGGWDPTPIFEVEGNEKDAVVCQFPAVKASRLCIRCLDTARADHSFAHLNEIEVYGRAETAARTLAASTLPAASASLTHDLAELDRQLEQLRQGGSAAQVRAAYLAKRRPFLIESAQWQQKLDEETRRSKAIAEQGVPEWAAALRDALARYRLWVHWWIAHQAGDGQFGGSYNDDVELCCGWPVLCLAQDDRITLGALKRLADGVWNTIPSVTQYGFDVYTDVEHSAEPTSYSQPRMVALEWGNPVYAARCRQTFETVLKEWMGTNPQGQLQFKSCWFGYDKAMKPKVNSEAMYDIPECAKALKPGLYAAWATGDGQVKEKLIAYGRTWAEAALSEYDGKPYGLLPARIHWDSGKSEGVQTRFPPMRAMYFHLIACYQWTGENLFLKPIAEMLRRFVVEDAVNAIPSASSYGKGEAKEYGLCLSQLALAASLWRRLSGDHSLDAHFERWTRTMSDSLPDGHKTFYSLDRNSPELWLPDAPSAGAFRMPRYALGTPFYLGWEVTGDKAFLIQACRNLSGDITDQWGPLTYWFYDKAEPRVTSNDHSAHSIQWAAFALCQMTTGGPGPIEAPYPHMAVSWRGGNEDFVPLVISHDPAQVRCLLYNFRSSPIGIRARFWQLDAGNCEFKLGEDRDGDDQMDRVLEQRGVSVQGPTECGFSLPGGGPYVLGMSRMKGGG